MNDTCVDCRRPATRTYGTIPICDTCWQIELLRILEHRSDLRDWGIGHPEGDYMRCDQCDATWFTDQLHPPCPWCVDRIRLQAEHQQELERDRFRDYLSRLRDGDLTCLNLALPLARKLQMTRQLAAAIAAGSRR